MVLMDVTQNRQIHRFEPCPQACGKLASDARRIKGRPRIAPLQQDLITIRILAGPIPQNHRHRTKMGARQRGFVRGG